MCACFLCASSFVTVSAGQLALVIDDVGYSLNHGRRAIELPGAVTIAVLPFAPHTQTLVTYADTRGRDIIVHQPMEPTPAPHARYEHDTLRLNMTSLQLRAAFARALDAIPQRKGVSNHTGSLLTAHERPMRDLMTELDRRGLFFLDSRTTADTVAASIAHEIGVPTLDRDVFLDHDPSPQAMQRAFGTALHLSRLQGHAVLVAHPHPATLDYLERRLRNLPNDVRLASISDVVARLTGSIRGPAPHRTELGQTEGPATPHISLGR